MDGRADLLLSIPLRHPQAVSTARASRLDLGLIIIGTQSGFIYSTPDRDLPHHHVRRRLIGMCFLREADYADNWAARPGGRDLDYSGLTCRSFAMS